MRPVKGAILFALLGSSALAQKPLSAIDWLEDIAPVPIVRQAPGIPPDIKNEPPVSETASRPSVDVVPLAAARQDAAGLLPATTTGLPKTLWSASKTSDLVRELTRLSPEPLPAIQALYYTLLLAESDPPQESGNSALLLQTRIAVLIQFGAVEPARALVEHAGPATPGLFDQWLDLTLLSGVEDTACRTLRDQPGLSQNYAARIYCTARTGDWATAALTYETAVALDSLSSLEADLLAQFLDPETIDSTPRAAPPKAINPLVFRLFEAVGNTLPTRNLPRAYAMADLRDTSGWKAEIEAAERLARTGALPANHLFGLYSERKPAASGGVWDRVDAIQDFDKALDARDPEAIATTLNSAWRAMQSQGLEVPFAQLFAERLHTAALPEDVRGLAFHVALLSEHYETARDILHAPSKSQQFLIGLSQGVPDAALATTGTARAIAAAFNMVRPAPSHEALLSEGKLGQAILMAAAQLDPAKVGRFKDITLGLATLRAVGLEDTARRAALQLLILAPVE